MLEAFMEWFEAHQALFAGKGIQAQISPATEGLGKNSIHAEFITPTHEWTVQLWETGESDFHWLTWEAADDGVCVTHHEFGEPEELIAALEGALEKRVRGSAPSLPADARPTPPAT